MAENFSLLNVTRTAGAAIVTRRICKMGAADGALLQASGPNDLLVAVAGQLAAAAAGDACEAHYAGIAPVEYGAVVTRGQELTSDSTGRAVPALDGDSTIGVAQESGGVGAIGSVQIEPGRKTPSSTMGFLSGAAVALRRFLKLSGGKLIQTSAAADVMLGVSELAAAATDLPMRMALPGRIVDIDLGGTVAAGAEMTSDAAGKGVAAAAGNRIGGICVVGGDNGEVGKVLLLPGTAELDT